jgi:hypothetical protein
MDKEYFGAAFAGPAFREEVVYYDYKPVTISGSRTFPTSSTAGVPVILEQLPKTSDREVVRVYNAPPEFGSNLRREVGKYQTEGDYVIESVDYFGSDTWQLVLKPIGTGCLSPIGGVAAFLGGTLWGAVSICRGVLGTIPLTIDWVVKPVLDTTMSIVDDVILKQIREATDETTEPFNAKDDSKYVAVRKEIPSASMPRYPSRVSPAHVATIGLDTSGDGYANYFVSGTDKNNDGIPDALQTQASLANAFFDADMLAPRVVPVSQYIPTLVEPASSVPSSPTIDTTSVSPPQSQFIVEPMVRQVGQVVAPISYTTEPQFLQTAPVVTTIAEKIKLQPVTAPPAEKPLTLSRTNLSASSPAASNTTSNQYSFRDGPKERPGKCQSPVRSPVRRNTSSVGRVDCSDVGRVDQPLYSSFIKPWK